MSTRSDPAQIGRYQVLERVGRGGMGVLFRGIDPVLDREVAIKLMLVDFSDDEEQMRPRFYARRAPPPSSSTATSSRSSSSPKKAPRRTS